MSNLGNKEVMAKNIRHYIKESKKTRKQVCQDLGIAYSTFTDWCCARKYPRIDKIEMMSNYFGIEKSDLIEDHSEINVELLANEQAKKFHKEIGTFIFTDDELDELISFTKYLMTKRGK